MGFRINTNINALSAHASATANNRALSSSLGRLNSGLRIQSAADDASGLAIADSLRSQASSLSQAIANGNDAIGIIQTADKAMDEQLKILDTVKAKAVQAAQDGQTTETRKAIQADISRLVEELDMIGNTTSFNGQKLLNGSFSNKEFQVGAYSNETVKASIGPTTSDKIGLLRRAGGGISFHQDISITFKNAENGVDIKIAPISSGNPDRLPEFVNMVNAVSGRTGIRAAFDCFIKGNVPLAGGETDETFSVNGVNIGKIKYEANDSTGALRAAINKVKDQTGVEATVNHTGMITLTNRSGRGGVHVNGSNAFDETTFGSVGFRRHGANEIVISGTGLHGFKNQDAISLRDAVSKVGVQELNTAMIMMDVAESAQKALDAIRSDLGSVQNQLVATVSNITVTQVNVKAAESNIRDVDFAAESATFSKHNILAQSGTYAMSQANAVQQNVMRLLQ